MSSLQVLLLDIFENHFNLSELKTFCFRLGINFENLPEVTLTGKARELIAYCKRHGRLRELIETGREHRPNFNWPEPPPAPSFEQKNLFIKTHKFPFHEPFYPLVARETVADTILRSLCAPEERAVVLVTGIGGIGKTAVAVEIVRRFLQLADAPFAAVAWESAKQELFVQDQIVRVKDAVITYPDLVDSLGEQIAGLNFRRQPEKEREKRLAQQLQLHPYLIVVDNLETTENAQEILHNLKQIAGRGKVLLTSREAVAGDAFHVPLQGLSATDSIVFMQQDVRQRNLQKLADIDSSTLEEIHQVTQGMPLAMKLVLSQAEMFGMEVTLDGLKQGQGDIYFFIFLESWRRLSDAAQKILLYMGPTASPVARGELERAVKLTGESLNQAIRELIALSLLNIQTSTGLNQTAYSIHQLTRYFIINNLPDHWRRQGVL